MKTKHHLLVIFAAFVLAGCYDDDKLWNAVNEQEQRIEALESWQKVVNNNIEALQTLVSGKHYITAVIPVTLKGETVGYTISFNDHDPITIYNGEKGEQGDKGDKGDQGPAGSTPVISIVQQPDGNWYWTLNGELIKDAEGNSIRANGQNGADGQPGQSAPVPLLKTGQQLLYDNPGGTWTPDAVYLSVDNGNTWKQVSGRNGVDGSDGDSMFTSVDYTSKRDYVIFTLANGSRIEVLKAKITMLELYSENARPDGKGGYKPWSTPFEIGEHVTVQCMINYPTSSTYHIEIVSPKGWKAEIGEGNTLKITAPLKEDLSTADYEGKLMVMLNVDNDPSIIRTLDLKLTDKFYLIGGGINELLNHYGYKGKSLVVNSKAMNEADFKALRANTTIQTLDLSEIEECKELPVSAFQSNLTLQKVILPNNLEVIGDSAFCRCAALQEIEIPAKVKIIPPRAFYKCFYLRKVILPEGLEKIEGGESRSYQNSDASLHPMFWGAFQECESLTEINIPSTCKWIGEGTFYMSGRSTPCGELTIEPGVTLGTSSFQRRGITKLTVLTREVMTDSFGVKYAREVFRECPYLKEVIFGDGLTGSPGKQEDFRDCKELETVKLPSTFTTIHAGMFAECKNLKSITWPISDISNIEIETGDIVYYDGKGSQNENDVSPFWRASDDFKIYVPDGLVDDMKKKFKDVPGLEDHFAPIPSKP